MCEFEQQKELEELARKKAQDEEAAWYEEHWCDIHESVECGCNDG